MQFEPSVFDVAVDGDGDGKIDLFDPEDAILSVAHYLVLHGWDDKVDHQKRAVYAYYGGHYDTDRDKYYMKAVLAYADAARTYLEDHPVDARRWFYAGTTERVDQLQNWLRGNPEDTRPNDSCGCDMPQIVNIEEGARESRVLIRLGVPLRN